jgi:hypothetical protein
MFIDYNKFCGFLISWTTTSSKKNDLLSLDMEVVNKEKQKILKLKAEFSAVC